MAAAVNIMPKSSPSEHNEEDFLKSSDTLYQPVFSIIGYHPSIQTFTANPAVHCIPRQLQPV
jgi:hypothetical protein